MLQNGMLHTYVCANESTKGGHGPKIWRRAKPTEKENLAARGHQVLYVQSALNEGLDPWGVGSAKFGAPHSCPRFESERLV